MTRTVQSPGPILAKIGLMRNCAITLEKFDSFNCKDEYSNDKDDNNKSNDTTNNDDCDNNTNNDENNDKLKNLFHI